MQTPRYQDIIQQPHLLRKIEVSVLKSWVETYPQVPLFRALLAAKGMQEGDSNAAKWLETAAIYASDRRQLKRLIQLWGSAAERQETGDNENANNIRETGDDRLETKDGGQDNVFIEVDNAEHLQEDLEADQIPVGEENSIEVDSRQEIVSPASANAIESELAVVSVEATEEYVSENDFQETTDAVEAIIAQDGSSTIGQWSADDIDFLKAIGKWEEEGIDAETPPKEEEWVMETPGKKIHVLKLTDIIDQGLAQTDIRWLAPWLEDFQISYTPSQPIQKQTEPVVEVVVPKTPDTPLTTASFAPAQAPLAVEIEDKKEDIPSNTFSSTHSFEEWLTILSRKQKSESADAPIFDLPHTDVVKGLSNVNQQETEITDLPADTTDAILEEEEVKKMAEESISVRDEMATETLARIYVKQGKLSHALNVYQILMQKYPEKSSYFAAQIQQLKAE
jgi:hypothetical protein